MDNKNEFKVGDTLRTGPTVSILSIVKVTPKGCYVRYDDRSPKWWTSVNSNKLSTVPVRREVEGAWERNSNNPAWTWKPAKSEQPKAASTPSTFKVDDIIIGPQSGNKYTVTKVLPNGCHAQGHWGRETTAFAVSSRSPFIDYGTMDMSVRDGRWVGKQETPQSSVTTWRWVNGPSAEKTPDTQAKEKALEQKVLGLTEQTKTQKNEVSMLCARIENLKLELEAAKSKVFEQTERVADVAHALEESKARCRALDNQINQMAADHAVQYQKLKMSQEFWFAEAASLFDRITKIDG